MSQSSSQLELDLNASRKSLFGQLVPLLDDNQKGLVGAAVGDASIVATKQFDCLDDVLGAISRASVSSQAKEEAQAVYRIIANALGQVQECSAAQASLGAAASGMVIREILGICICVLQLPYALAASPVQVHDGQGVMDPAVAAVFQELDVPFAPVTAQGTPCDVTSAALIAHFVSEFCQ